MSLSFSPFSFGKTVIENTIAQLKNAMDADELARQMKEAERLKQEADMRAALAKQEEDALAERRRRDEEEKEKVDLAASNRSWFHL